MKFRQVISDASLKVLLGFSVGRKPEFVPDENAPFLKGYSLIDNEILSRLVKKISFTSLDVRAAWLGPGLPKLTKSLHKNQNFAAWATEHLMMYMAFLPQIKKLPRNARTADVGCGVGYPTVCLGKIFPGYSFIGVDYDKLAIKVANRFNKLPNVEYFDKSIFDFKASKKFDCIMALEILEHIPPQEHNNFINGCLNLLKRGGLLLISTPNSLDEPDADYSHVGLLNRGRAKQFFKNYRSLIKQAYFVNNKKLLTLDVKKFLIKRPFGDFEKNKKLSHFHFVLVKR